MNPYIMRTFLLTILSAMAMQTFASGVFNVRDFGAAGDGKQLDNTAINRAIDSCAANGGGQVLLPAGTYLCGSIHLKSNIDLHLSQGAKIIGASGRLKVYDESEKFDGPEYQDGGHTYFHNSLIWGENLVNVSVTGQGMIDGGGMTEQDTENDGNIKGGSIGTGDKSIALKLCRNVVIRDVTIFHGGHFAIIVTGCDRVNMDNITIDTNRDGIDIDCCRFVTVENCKVNSPKDDGIVLKSSYALHKPVICDNIVINNCIVSGYQEGTFLDGSYIPQGLGYAQGRIKLGTESNGGYRNVTISNCTFMYCCGLALEVVDQGVMENIVVNNISMSHVTYYPIYITTGCRNRGPKDNKAVSSACDIQISNVTVDDCDSYSGIQITGMEGTPLRNIRLSNIQIRYNGGGTKEEGSAGFKELGAGYPEPRFIGRNPAYGLYARHVDGLDLSHITFFTDKPDYRPAIITDDVNNVSMEHISVPVQGNVKPARFIKSGNIKISNSPTLDR